MIKDARLRAVTMCISYNLVSFIIKNIMSLNNSSLYGIRIK